MKRAVDDEADACCDKGNQEDEVIVRCPLIDEHPDCRGDSCAEIVAQPIIADALGASA